MLLLTFLPPRCPRQAASLDSTGHFPFVADDIDVLGPNFNGASILSLCHLAQKFPRWDDPDDEDDFDDYFEAYGDDITGSDDPIEPDFDLPPEDCLNVGTDNSLWAAACNSLQPDDPLGEWFSNCLGFELINEGGLLSGRVETNKRKKSFLSGDLWGGPSTIFRALPHLWAHKSTRKHHFAGVFLATYIQAKELGFDSPIDFVRCRGWTYNRRQGKVNLRYRKIEDAYNKNAPNEKAAELSRNFNAMIDRLYDLICDPEMNDICTGLPWIRHLDKESFKAKLHNYAQEFHFALIITETFFMPHVTTHRDDTMHWIKRIFRPCRMRKDFVMMMNACFQMFPDNGDSQLATELLTKYPDCVRDEIMRRAANKQHRTRYASAIEEAIGKAGRTSRRGAQPSKSRNLLFARCRCRDMTFPFLEDNDRLNFWSSTRKVKPRKTKTGAKRKASAGGELFDAFASSLCSHPHCLFCCPFWQAHLFCLRRKRRLAITIPHPNPRRTWTRPVQLLATFFLMAVKQCQRKACRQRRLHPRQMGRVVRLF